MTREHPLDTKLLEKEIFMQTRNNPPFLSRTYHQQSSKLCKFAFKSYVNFPEQAREKPNINLMELFLPPFFFFFRLDE